MSGVLVLRNRQRARKVDTPYLRQIIRSLLEAELVLRGFELGIYLVDEPEITRLNETYLQHAGATDVISFDYGAAGDSCDLAGEIFVCVPVAVAQAARFRTSWQQEIVRYIVHGTLHLLGHDDQAAGPRRKMKKEEDRLVRRLSADFSLKNVKTGGAATR